MPSFKLIFQSMLKERPEHWRVAIAGVEPCIVLISDFPLCPIHGVMNVQRECSANGTILIFVFILVSSGSHYYSFQVVHTDSYIVRNILLVVRSVGTNVFCYLKHSYSFVWRFEFSAAFQ